jgi:serine/threonine protein kinase
MTEKPPDPSQPADSSTPRPGPRPSSKAGRRPPFERLGHFRVLAPIGGGSVGAVYKGYDESLDRHVVIKVLSPRLARDANCVRRFREEATAAARIAHPNVVAIHYVGEDAGHHFFVMDLVEGPSLAGRLAERGPLPLDDALAITEQCLAGLQAAHSQGLLHQNLKPSNILLEKDTGRAVLTDFGRVVAAPGGAVGTVTDRTGELAAYVAPEQRRSAPSDPGVDLYALGVVLYQMLGGRLPREADSDKPILREPAQGEPHSLRELARDMPKPVAALVAQLTAESPLERYLDCSTALNDLLLIRKSRARSPAVPAGAPTTFETLSAPDFAEPVRVPAGIDRMAVSSAWQRLRDWAARLPPPRAGVRQADADHRATSGRSGGRI